MKYECEMIEDLLPLYKDGACSTASTRAVEEHIAECPKCKEIFNILQDTKIDDMIALEKEDVIGSQAKFFKRKSAVAGSIVAGIFMIPILICLVVALAGGNGLGWFFIVLAAMLIPSSLFVVPLMAPKNRMFLTMTSFTLSVMILLAVCCIYSGGKWFFIAASAVLFGLTIWFAPFIACRRPVNAYLKNFKGVAVMAAYTFTYFLMIICIGITVAAPGYFRLAFSISVPLFIIAWLMFLIIRYLPANGLVKAGVCILMMSAVGYLGSLAIAYFMVKGAETMDVLIYSDPSPLMMIIGVGIGIIFGIIGILVGKRGGKN
ncbi:MAG: zf-HC2 domain-containing protein [Eubacterium sp.]|nr:zf-HC2 domain-containing protein [Eubacterium sp.]